MILIMYYPFPNCLLCFSRSKKGENIIMRDKKRPSSNLLNTLFKIVIKLL